MPRSPRSPLLAGLSVRSLATQTFHGMLSDDLTGRSAQLAYYFFLAIFPGFLFLTAVLGLLSTAGNDVRNTLMHYLPHMVPPQAWAILEQGFTQSSKVSGTGKLTVGVLAALWSATAGMSAACDTLNGVHDVTESRPYWKVQATALGLTLATGLLVMLGLAVLFSGDTLLRMTLSSTLHWPMAVLAKTFEVLVLLVCVTLSFAITYYWAPDIKERKWHWITPGAAFGIAMWILSTIGMRVYLHFNDSYSASYGAVGAVIILLLWFYLTGFSMLLGAEVNAVIEDAAAKQGAPDATPKGHKRPHPGA